MTVTVARCVFGVSIVLCEDSVLMSVLCYVRTVCWCQSIVLCEDSVLVSKYCVM